jgi:hypothetical protein
MAGAEAAPALVQILPAFCRANRPVNVSANLSSAMIIATWRSSARTSARICRRSARSFLARWTRSPRLLPEASGSWPQARLNPWPRSRSNVAQR